MGKAIAIALVCAALVEAWDPAELRKCIKELL
jgi:hypothetical protein